MLPLPNLHARKGCSLVGLTCRLSQGSSSTQRPNAGVCLGAYQASPDGDLSAWREREAHWKGKGSGEEWRWVYQDETDSTLGVKKICDLLFSFFSPLLLCSIFAKVPWIHFCWNKESLCDKRCEVWKLNKSETRCSLRQEKISPCKVLRKHFSTSEEQVIVYSLRCCNQIFTLSMYSAFSSPLIDINKIRYIFGAIGKPSYPSSKRHSYRCCLNISKLPLHNTPAPFVYIMQNMFDRAYDSKTASVIKICGGSNVALLNAVLQDASMQTRELIDCNVILSASAGYWQQHPRSLFILLSTRQHGRRHYHLIMAHTFI